MTAPEDDEQTAHLRASGSITADTLCRLLDRGIRRAQAKEERRQRFDVRGTLCAVPEVVALRKKVANICNDEDCTLSGGDAHAGPCEACGCGLEHAALECHVATVAGWKR